MQSTHAELVGLHASVILSSQLTSTEHLAVMQRADQDAPLLLLSNHAAVAWCALLQY